MQMWFPSNFDGPKYWSNFSYFYYKFNKNNEFETWRIDISKYYVILTRLYPQIPLLKYVYQCLSMPNWNIHLSKYLCYTFFRITQIFGMILPVMKCLNWPQYSLCLSAPGDDVLRCSSEALKLRSMYLSNTEILKLPAKFQTSTMLHLQLIMDHKLLLPNLQIESQI